MTGDIATEAAAGQRVHSLFFTPESESIYLDVYLKWYEDGNPVTKGFITGKTLGESGDDLDRMFLISSAITKAFHGDGASHARYIRLGESQIPASGVFHLSLEEQKTIIDALITQHEKYLGLIANTESLLRRMTGGITQYIDQMGRLPLQINNYDQITLAVRDGNLDAFKSLLTQVLEYSFHWTGSSDRLYVFEAPIDLLSFLTLYPQDWQKHSYVALCGTSEHAMLWMLEQNPQIRKVALCLDHDEAGIEASGQHEDTLRERGIAAAPLRSQYKDWNADLKALHGLPAEPAEEHPQLLAADPICQRIGAAVSSGVAKPEQAEQKLPILLQDYKNHLHQGRFDRAMDAMELAAAMALSSALREFRQMGKVVSPQQGAERLRQSIQPHHNRGSLKNRADEIAMELQRILAQKASAGICGRESKESLAYRWLELAASCAKVPIRYEADQIKQRQKEEQAQRGAGPVME